MTFLLLSFVIFHFKRTRGLEIFDLNCATDTNWCIFFSGQDSKLRQIVTMGSQDTLEEKTVTLCYGADFVNLTFINFCCTKKEIAQVSLLTSLPFYVMTKRGVVWHFLIWGMDWKEMKMKGKMQIEQTKLFRFSCETSSPFQSMFLFKIEWYPKYLLFHNIDFFFPCFPSP